MPDVHKAYEEMDRLLRLGNEAMRLGDYRGSAIAFQQAVDITQGLAEEYEALGCYGLATCWRADQDWCEDRVRRAMAALERKEG